MREDFMSIKKMIEQAKRDKIYLLKQTIPGIENVNSWQILEQLAYVFNEQKFLKNDYLSFQGERSNTIYILVSGKLEVSRLIELEVDDPKQKYMSKLNKFFQGSIDGSQTNKTKNLNKSAEQSSLSMEKSQDLSKQQLKEQIEIKICDIDTPQFICEDILVSRSQQYNVKVSSGKAFCYVITKKQFQSKFPRESVEMVKQLFQAKQERRFEMISQQIQKYSNKFKIVERQESMKEQNQKFKQKFKKQYLNKIYNESILKMNADSEKHKKELIYQFEKTEEESKEEKQEMFKKFAEAKQFIQKKSFPMKAYHESIKEDQQIHKEYMKGITEMKKNFSDFLLECAKKAVDSNCVVIYKQKQSINNHNASNLQGSVPKFHSSNNLNSSKRLSIIEEGEGIETKRGSIISFRGNQSRQSIQSMSPTLILRKSIIDESN